jgi:CDGSH-type Zn-finger protein
LKGQIVQRSPFVAQVEEGKTYYWCACGKSASQPFCDGSHQGSAFSPKAYTANKSGAVYFCGCKQTNSAPLCDGSHAKI